MVITKNIVANKILEYLHHKISLSKLVDWSEITIMEGEFEESNFNIINDVLSRLALADVKAFGLMWEDCEKYLNSLGYKVKIDAKAI